MDQVFISYSSRNEDIAAAICDRFEKSRLRCWMASRDAPPGENFARSIVDAIDGSRLMLVVLSKDANESVHVISEINRAVDRRVPILPVKVDDAALTPEFDYYLGRTHWFDASRSPLQAHLDKLASNVQRLLDGQWTAMPVAAAQDEPEQPVDLEDLQIPPEQVADRDKEMEKRLSYTVQVSRNKPACLIMLVDQSFSMNFPIAGRNIKKKDAVADVVNNVLFNAVLASTMGDGVRHYFDVGVLGYGVDDGVKSAFDTDLVPIQWVADNPKGWKRKSWEEDDGEGGTVLVEEDYPVWLEPFAKGRTLMKDAFERALAVVSDWADAHKDSFPPIVLHITDGGASSDQDPALLVRKLQEQYTNVGSALVFNCHVSEKQEQPVMFPGAAAVEGLEVRARQLYEMSSPLPEPMRREAVLLGYQVEMGARGYVRNADAGSLVHFLDIGTKPVWAGVVEG